MFEQTMSLAVELRHQLHAHPELSCEEQWTKQHLMEFLQQHTALRVVDMGAWFYAVYQGKPEGPIHLDHLSIPFHLLCEKQVP